MTTDDVPASNEQERESTDAVSLERAFMDIPDAENEAILDAKRTTVITVISAVVFIAVVFLFIL